MTEIKVGSKWVNRAGRMFTILAIDEDELFIKYDSGEHGLVSEKALKAFCKPAPVCRTVWLNVYDGYADCYNSKNRADNSICSGLLFQQEVELIDPRGGACGK